MAKMNEIATPEQVKQNLVDKISSDLGLVLDDETEIKEMLYLAFTLGQREDGLAYHNAVNESLDVLQENMKHFKCYS